MSTEKGAKQMRVPAIIVAIMMFFTVFAIIPATDLGKVYAAGETGKVTATLLNVRSGAGTNYSRIGTMIKGKTFTVTGTAKDKSGVTWYKLTYNSRSGYVSSKYVDIIQPTVTSVSNLMGTVNTKSDPLTIRSGPGKSYSRLGTLAKGKTFSITGKTTDSSGTVWYRFTFNGKTAYASSAYVKTTSTASSSSSSSSSVTALSNTTGTVATKSDPLIIRSGPGTSYSKLGTLAKGKTFTVTGKTTDSSGTVWYRFTFNGKTAYASSKYVTIKTVTPPAQEPETDYKDEVTDGKNDTTQTVVKKTGTVNTKKDPLIIRSGAGKSYKNIGNIAKGKTFTILDEVKDSTGLVWYKLTYSGKTGYVSSAYVIKKEEVIESDGNGETGTTTPEETTPAPEPVTFQVGTANADHGLNVRTGPGTGYSRLTVLAKGTTVTVTGSAKASNGKVWYTYQYSSTKTGYVCADYFTVKTVTSDSAFEAYLTSQRFPESYKASLRALHAEHPQWVFKAVDPGFTWDEALEKQTSNMSANLINPGAPVSYRNPDSYDSAKKSWYQPDSGWYVASDSVVAHYMDPRNFLNESAIFQFMPHKYDGTSQNESTVAKVIDGSFMENTNPGGGYTSYKALLNAAGKNSGVNPNVLAAMIIQEQGWDGSSLTSGKYKGYEGYYNFFNIGAYKADGMSAVERGLWYAKGGDDGKSTSYSRPWNSPYKAILGGAQYYKNGYLDQNQYTYYTKRFNIMNGLSKVGTGQYMTYVAAAANEGTLVKKAYEGNDTLPIVFEIPVFKNMPSTACPLQ